MPQPHAAAVSLLSASRPLFALLFCAVILLGSVSAQQSAAVPALVRFSGTISGAPAGTADVVFAIYKDQTGGAPLWQEVQVVTVDASGRYSALLGARSNGGVPAQLFSSNEARWLGIAAPGQPEQPRVLLVSVPYAIKAADAETLGGLPASAFLRASAEPPFVNSAAIATAAANIAPQVITVTGATAGYLPVFTDANGDLANSVIAQAGGKVGIGTTAPAATLDLVGTSPTIRVANISATAGSAPTLSFVGARGTPAAPTATQANDYLGVLGGSGHNGTALTSQRARITFAASENWTSTANGASISFFTTTSGTTATAERMHISTNGNVGIGIHAPASVLSVAGVIQSTAGGFKFPDGSTQTTAGLPSASAVVSFNGRNGAVMPTTGDYTVSQVTGAVPNSITINGHALNSNVVVSASDLTTGTLPHAQLPSLVSADIPSGLPNVAYINASNTFGGNQAVAGSLSVLTGDVRIDPTSIGSGSSMTPGLVFGSGATSGIASNMNSSGGQPNVGGLDFYTNGTKQMSLTTSGAVGIGTQTPGAALEVNGSLKLSSGSNGAITFQDSTTQSTATPANLTAMSQQLGTSGYNGAGFKYSADCMIGDIILSVNAYGGGAIPADGSLLQISQYPVVYDILGTRFGGDGTTTFGVPDMRPFAPNGLQYSICVLGIFPSRN